MLKDINLTTEKELELEKEIREEDNNNWSKDIKDEEEEEIKG